MKLLHKKIRHLFLRHYTRKQRTMIFYAFIICILFIISFFIRILEKKITKTALSTPRFQRQLFGPYAYSGKIPGANMTASLGVEKENAVINIGRGGGTIQFNLPLKNATLRSKDGVITYSIPEHTLDVRYQLTQKGVKEEIILNKIPNTSQLKSNLELHDLILKITPEGTPVFYNAKGEYQFHFERPFIKDAKGNISYGVKYKFAPTADNTNSPGTQPVSDSNNQNMLFKKAVEKVENGIRYSQQLLGSSKELVGSGSKQETYTLFVEIDPAWLYDKKRTFPITIDPTVVYDTSSEFAAGTLNRLTDIGSGTAPMLQTYYQELPATLGTVGLWHMNEGAGTSTADSSGNGNTGTLGTGSSAPTWQTATNSRLGASSLSFDGNDYVSAGTSINLANSSFTLEAWAKRGTAGAYHGIIGQGVATTNNGLQFGFRSTNVFFCGFYANDLDTTTTYTDTDWHHWACSYDSNTKQRILYQDGIFIAANTATSNYTGTGQLNIGGLYSTPVSFFQGIIDELAIYKRALTPEEIKTHAQRRPYSVFTSDVIDLTNIKGWNPLSWNELGVQTGDGEILAGTANLVAQWNLNELTGGTANNNSGTCGATCNGNLTGFQNTTGQDIILAGSNPSGWTANNKRWGAGALMFDGVDDYVSIPDNAALKPANTLTVEAWVNPADSATWHQIVTKRYSEASDPYNSYILSQDTTSKAWGFSISNGTPGSGAAAYDTEPMKGGQWYHLVGTYDGANVKLYVNGVLKATTIKTGDIGYSSLPLRIGTSNVSAGQYAKGIIDTVRIYNRVLGASEILSNYQAGNIEFQTRTGTTTNPNGGTWEEWRTVTNETQLDSMDGPYQYNTTDSGLVSYWPMDETADNTCSGGVNDVCDKKGSDDGASFGTKITEGKFGKARSFNGTTDYVDAIPLTGLPASTNTITVEYWQYITNDVAYQESMMAQADDGTNRLNIHADWGGTTYWDFGNISSGGRLSVAFNDSWHNVWAHWAFVSENGVGMKMYRNGVLIGSNGTTSTFTKGTKTLRFGRIDTENYLKGMMDEVRIYTTALSALTIYQHYLEGSDGSSTVRPSTNTSTKLEGTASQKVTLGSPAVDASTVGLWHLDETGGTGAYLKDEAGYYAPNATGGTITYSGGYTIHTFLSSGTFTPNAAGNVEVLVVGGGGGTGSVYQGGGGGGGGIVYNSSYSVTTSPITVTVGNGGNGSAIGAETQTSGADSIFGNMTAYGGGRGGSETVARLNGGSGGGSSHFADQTASSATQGTNGTARYGSGGGETTGAASPFSSPGGGGAGAASLAVDESAASPGAGGIGVAFNISGSTVYYGGGGAGSNRSTTTASGGLGGGGATGTVGTPNTGGGGGAGSHTSTPTRIGGAGGSGIVIIRYPSYLGSRLYNNGTPTNTTVVDGKFSKARYFNNTSSYIEIPASSVFNFGTSDWAFETWIKPSSFELCDTIYSQNNPYSILRLYCSDASKWEIYNNSVQYIGPAHGMVAGQWYHIAVVRSSNTIYLYQNGTLIWSFDVSTNPTNLGGAIWRIGNSTWAGEYFNGIIDEFRVSNIARSADEVAESYRAGRDHHFSKTITSTDLSTKTKVPFWIASDRQGTFLETTVGESSFANYEPDANTVGLWKLEDENSLSASDSTGNSNNGFMNQDQILHTQYDGIVGHPADHAGMLADFTPTTLYVKEINNSINVPSQSVYDQRDNMYSTWLNVKYTGTWSFAVDGDDAVEVEVDGTVVAAYYGAHGFCACQTYAGTINLTAGWHKLIARHEEDGGGEGIIVYYKDPNDAAWSILTSANLGASATLHASLPTDAYVSTSTYISNGLPYPNFITQGKIGKARSFNGSSDYIEVPNSTSLNLTGSQITLEAWVYPTASLTACNGIISKSTPSAFTYSMYGGGGCGGSTNTVKFIANIANGVISNTALALNTWSHVVGTYDGSNIKVYINGKLDMSAVGSGTMPSSTNNLYIGQLYNYNGTNWPGVIDEPRVSSTARTAGDIRQAYEIGRRTHPITIDFKAKLDAGNLIADSSDLSFIVDGTGYGASIKGAGVYVGDKIIVKENYNGTEYIAQGTVSSVTASTGAVTVISWDAGSTFPTGGQTGFSANATVFKWQKEYFDLTGITTGVGGTDPVNQRNAVNRLTFRTTDGSEGANIWLDDMRYSDPYLTNFLGSTVPSSTNRYFQYRTILSSNDTQVSPSLSSVTLDYTQNKLFLLTDGTVPAGWSCVSCDTTAPFYQKYIRGAVAYSTIGGGTETHTPTVNTNTVNATTSQRATATTNSRAATSHEHTSANPTMGSANNLPEYRTLKVISYDNGIPTGSTAIPAGTIAIFDGTVPANWIRYGAADGKYIRGDTTPSLIGGTNAHTHTITWQSLAAAIGNTSRTGGTATRATATNHTHNAPLAGLTNIADCASSGCEPPFITAVLGQSSVATGIPVGMIGMFDGIPASGWLTVSGSSGTNPFYNRFFKGSSGYGVTGGSETHNHTSITSGTSPAAAATSGSGTGTGTASETHTHTITTTFNAGDTNFPRYVDVVMAKRQVSISGTVRQADESTAIGNPPCNGAANVIEARVNGGGAVSTTCAAADSTYSLTVNASAGDVVTLLLNSSSPSKANTVLIVGSSSDVTSVDFFQNRVVARNDNGSSITNANLGQWDNDNDAANMLFTSNSNNFSSEANTELHIWTGANYAPGGTVTTDATAGNFHLDTNSLATIPSGTSVIGQDITVGTGATFTVNSDLVVGGGDITTNATSTVRTTSGTPTVTMRGTGSIGTGGTISFYNLKIGDATIASTTFAVNLTASGDIAVGNGSSLELGGKNITVGGGDFTTTGTGIITCAGCSAGTVTMTTTGSLGGGNGNITFYNLSTVTSGATTFLGGGTNSVLNNVSVGTGTTFNINSSISITGNITNTTTGVINTTSGTPTVTVSGSTIGGGSGVVTFHNLTIAGSTTLQSSITLNGDGAINNGTSLALNDKNVTVSGGDLTTTGTGAITCAGCSAGTVTMTTTGSLGGGNGNLTFYNVSTLTSGATTFSGGGTNSVLNNVSVGTGTTLNLNSTISITGSLTNTTTGVINYTSGTPTVTVSGTTLGSGTGKIRFYNLTKAGAGVTTFSGSGTNTVDNNLSVSAGTLTQSAIVTVTNDVSVSAGAILNTNANLTITGGDLTTIGSGTVNTTSGTGTVTLTNTGNIGGGGSVTVYNLTIGGTQTAQSNITITNDGGISTAGVFALNSKNITVSGGDLITTGTGTITCVGCAAGTVTISGSGNIGGGAGTITFYNLGINGTQTLQTDITISNDGNVATAGNFALNGKNVIVNGGDLTTAGTGIVSCAGCGAGTLTMNSTGNIGGGGNVTVYNLGINGTQTLQSDIVITNDGSIATAGVFALNSKSATVNGGDLTTTGTGTITCTGCSAGTVTMTTTGSLGGGNGNLTFYNVSTLTSGATTFSGGGTNSVLNNVSVGTGTTLNLNSTISITGSLTNTTTGVINTTSGTPTVTVSGSTIGGGSGVVTFYNLTKSASGNTTFSGSGANSINNALTISAGTFTQANNIIIGTSGVANSGAISATGTLTYSGTPTMEIRSSSGGSATIGGAGSITFYNLLFTPAVASPPTFTIGSAGSQTVTVTNDFTVGNGTNGVIVNTESQDPTLDINGNFSTLASGTFQSSSTGIFTIAKNFTNNGTFTPNTGTVTFDTSNTAILTYTAATTFYGFSSSSASKVFYFDNVDQTNVTGSFSINGGACGTMIQLYSDSTGNQYDLNVTGSKSVQYADIKDSNAVAAITATTSRNSGNNSANWSIGLGACGSAISGNIYSNEGGSVIDCSGGNTKTVTVKVQGQAAYSSTCTTADGAYSVDATIANANDVITAYLDGATEKATTVTLAVNTGPLSGLDLYQNRNIFRYENTGPITNANLGQWDSDDDSDIQFTSNSNNLSVLNGTELHVLSGKTYSPGGTISIAAGSVGDLHVASNALATIDTGSTNTIGGDIVVASGGILRINASTNVNGGDITTAGTGSVTTTSGTPVVTISGSGNIGGGSGGITFYDLAVNGTQTLSTAITANSDISVGNGASLELNGKNVNISGGAFTTTGTGTITCAGCVAGTVTITGTGNIGGGGTVTVYDLTKSTNGTSTVSSATTVLNDLDVGVSTILNGSSDLNVNGGDMTGTGTISMSGGTTLLAGTGTFGNTTDWSFNNLTFGDGSANATTAYETSTITVNGVLTVASFHILNAGSKIWDLMGNGTPFVISGTFTPQTSTVSYENTTSANVTAVTYGNLQFSPASGTPTYTLLSGAISTNGNFTLAGAGNGTVNAESNDPSIDINGNFVVGTGDTFQASSTGFFTVSDNLTNNGTFTANTGTVTLDTTNTSIIGGTGNPTITFNNLTSIIGGKTIQFTQNLTFRVNGLLTLIGTHGNNLQINSTTSTQWLINHQGTENVQFVTVTNSGCNGSSADINVYYGSNGGNNGACWLFESVGFRIDGLRMEGLKIE